MVRTDFTEPQCLYSGSKTLPNLWAVWLEQSLSAGAVELNLYSPCGPYGIYRASVLVQYNFNSTKPMGRKNSTDP